MAYWTISSISFNLIKGFRYLQFNPAALHRFDVRHPWRCTVKLKGKVRIRANWLELYPVSEAWMEATRSISITRWMGCLSIAGLPPALNLPVSIYTPGWRDALLDCLVGYPVCHVIYPFPNLVLHKDFALLIKSVVLPPWSGSVTCVLRFILAFC